MVRIVRLIVRLIVRYRGAKENNTKMAGKLSFSINQCNYTSPVFRYFYQWITITQLDILPMKKCWKRGYLRIHDRLLGISSVEWCNLCYWIIWCSVIYMHVYVHGCSLERVLCHAHANFAFRATDVSADFATVFRYRLSIVSSLQGSLWINDTYWESRRARHYA